MRRLLGLLPGAAALPAAMALAAIDFEDASAGVDTDPTSNPDLATHTFDTPGTYRYFCEVHGAAGGVGMSGTVVVQGPDVTPTPTSEYVLPAVLGLHVAPRIEQHKVRGWVKATPSLARVRVSLRHRGAEVRHVIVRAKDRRRKTPFAIRAKGIGRRATVAVVAAAGATQRSKTVRLRG